jgi:hypothetical protein
LDGVRDLNWASIELSPEFIANLENLHKKNPESVSLFRGSRGTEMVWYTDGKWYSHPYRAGRKTPLAFDQVERILSQDAPDDRTLDQVIRHVKIWT